MPEGLWNRHTLMKVLDITPARLLELLRYEILPAPVLLNDEPAWRAQEIRQWMKTLNAATPAEAVSALWTKWQHEEAELFGIEPEGGHDA